MIMLGNSGRRSFGPCEVMDRLYSATPDGYCGDEDNGQTYAWYVFSALGFYPVCPGSDEYAIGSPLFREAVISLENGAEIRITANDNNASSRYVGSITVDGKAWPHNLLDYAALSDGAEIEFEMRPEPVSASGDFPGKF